MFYRYKIEEWDRDIAGNTFFVAFVAKRRWWGGVSWTELGRADNLDGAESICREHRRPPRQPRLYTEDAI